MENGYNLVAFSTNKVQMFLADRCFSLACKAQQVCLSLWFIGLKTSDSQHAPGLSAAELSPLDVPTACTHHAVDHRNEL